MSATLFEIPTPALLKLIPRDYQVRAHDEAFRLWDSGVKGVLIRAATGAGKTPMACMTIDTWLRRGPNHKVMVVSYETQLVWQFAQEIEDFLGITPGIEMGEQAVSPDHVPKIIVACRPSLLRATGPEPQQVEELKSFGFHDLGACHKRFCKLLVCQLRRGTDPDVVREWIANFNRRPEVANGFYSRLHKFDWHYNWLLIFDEAHRHAKSLISVGHVVDWFDQNPESRRCGLTATPKRSDGKSIGYAMFPGVALDYPLYSPVKPCAVKDGFAVPYVQKYIESEVDFKSIKKIAGDYDPEDLERKLGEEAVLAKLIEPLLDMVGDRRTLIFSPGVEMAKNVALYINARVPALCPHCHVQKWYPKALIGDGATCPCGKFIEAGWVTNHDDAAEALWGEIPDKDRRDCYRLQRPGYFLRGRLPTGQQEGEQPGRADERPRLPSRAKACPHPQQDRRRGGAPATHRRVRQTQLFDR
jgi:superfamily II DNA or RNA helicase